MAPQRKFNIVLPYHPAGDQAAAIQQLTRNLQAGVKDQVLLGVTGSGKTFTVANVINRWQRPTLVLAHNKTLAMQLYVELKTLFPHNRVEYFVSNFDFYQPEAYVPSQDLYISKDVRHNLELDMMRLSATNALLTRPDTIVVASVAAIFAAQDPAEYRKTFFEIKAQAPLTRQKILRYLVHSGYERNDYELQPGRFAAKGGVIKIAPGYISRGYIRIDLWNDAVNEIALVDFVNGHVIKVLAGVTIFPAQSYVTAADRLAEAICRIRTELTGSYQALLAEGEALLAKRLKTRTENDLEDLEEYGFCSGIENYTRHLTLKAAGEKPYTLLDYFGSDFITIIDESHMTLPQVRGMFNTNLSRKQTLVKYGFRLPSAIDNRPLNFIEFTNSLKQVIYVSATPGDYELKRAQGHVVEQIVRPTGLVDPMIEVVPTSGQMDKIIHIINGCKQHHNRVIVTTLTKRMSEELTSYLNQFSVKAVYLHSDLKTLERSVIINDLRRGVYDCLIGVNLLREGIDIPEIAAVCVLDADKHGFLRDARSLIQTIGRAARNIRGRAYLFADTISTAMQQAIAETNRRRLRQTEYNQMHHITPTTIVKPTTRPNTIDRQVKQVLKLMETPKSKRNQVQTTINRLRHEMNRASRELNFERAAQIRDLIINLNQQVE